MSQRWSEEALRKLEHPDEWDWERAETVSPPKAPRFTVAITFGKEDFAEVASRAERLGKKVTEFIREAALACSWEPTMAAEGTSKGRTTRDRRDKGAPQGD